MIKVEYVDGGPKKKVSYSGSFADVADDMLAIMEAGMEDKAFMQAISMGMLMYLQRKKEAEKAEDEETQCLKS